MKWSSSMGMYVGWWFKNDLLFFKKNVLLVLEKKKF